MHVKNILSAAIFCCAAALSQFGQDAWVLAQHPAGFRGFFLDVGSGDGQHFSNSARLEQEGWRGICVDAFPRNMQGRTAAIVQATLSSENRQAAYAVPSSTYDLSGLVDALGLHREDVLRQSARHVVKTMTLAEVLDGLQAPSHIDYLSLDVEGSEYDVLSIFPFDRYSFGAITVEHNYEEPKRQRLRVLLEAHGYAHEKSVHVDDFYVRRTTTEGGRERGAPA